MCYVLQLPSCVMSNSLVIQCTNEGVWHLFLSWVVILHKNLHGKQLAHPIIHLSTHLKAQANVTWVLQHSLRYQVSLLWGESCSFVYLLPLIPKVILKIQCTQVNNSMMWLTKWAHSLHIPATLAHGQVN